MRHFIRIIISLVGIAIIVVLGYFANRYSYIDNVTISIKENNEYYTIEPYRYDINKIKRYFMFTDTFTDHKVEEAFECLYRVVINDTDEICYDGGTHALYTKNKESLNDLKESVKKKDINVKKSKAVTKTIVLNKGFRDLLKSL